MSKERLLKALNESESVEKENNFDDARKKKDKKEFNEFRDRFFKPKIKEIRRDLYEIENKNNLSTKNKRLKKSSRNRKQSFLTEKRIMIMMILNTKE